MRVLLVSSNWPPVTPGGAEAYVAALAEQLDRAGHVVGALTLGVPGPDVVAVVPPRPHRLDEHAHAPRAARIAFHLADLHRTDVDRVIGDAIGRFRPDVVHSHVVTGMSVRALQAPTRHGAPHVHTLHDHWLTCWRSTATSRGQGPCGPACRAVRRRRLGQLRPHGPDVLVGISRGALAQHDPLPSGLDDTEVVLHPADVLPRRRPPRDDGGPVTVGLLGQLNPNKGVDTFLAAAVRLRDEARFVVAGRGRLADRVRAATGSSLEYRGWVAGDDREAFFDDIDVLVVPSVWPEPAGLVAREAAARGLPVVASRVGGLPEYVPAASRPLLFPAGDVDALVDRLRRVVADPHRWVGDLGDIPTWDDHLEALEAVYGRARSRHHAAA